MLLAQGATPGISAFRRPGQTMTNRDPLPADAAVRMTPLQLLAIVATLAVAFGLGFFAIAA